MNIETLGVIITIVIAVGGVFVGLFKLLQAMNDKKIIALATEVVRKSQSCCLQERNTHMLKVNERLNKLERNDTQTELTILSIQKDLETLTGHHETTQSMILDLQGYFQETTKDLIKTIQTFGVK